MQIRSLDPIADRALVDAFFVAIADYIELERGEPPSPKVTEEFFTDTPPGCDPAASMRLGLFDAGQLIAVTETAFGYPEPDSAYIGFLAVSAAARGKGAGSILLRHVETTARARNARHIYLGVLDANPRGRAFWEREGFSLALANRPITLGPKTQIAHRLGKPL
jgi:ribosomal protein S18 acetylase RimI-like enzyme